MAEVPLTNHDIVSHARHGAERARTAIRDAEIPVLDPVDRMQDDPDLAYLNRHWQLATATPVVAGGPFVRVRRWLKAQASGVVESVLARYFQEERDLLANVVRVQNELARRIDALAQEVRVLDGATYRFSAAFREACADLRERDEVLRRLLERRLAERAPGEGA